MCRSARAVVQNLCNLCAGKLCVRCKNLVRHAKHRACFPCCIYSIRVPSISRHVRVVTVKYRTGQDNAFGCSEYAALGLRTGKITVLKGQVLALRQAVCCGAAGHADIFHGQTVNIGHLEILFTAYKAGIANGEIGNVAIRCARLYGAGACNAADVKAIELQCVLAALACFIGCVDGYIFKQHILELRDVCLIVDAESFHALDFVLDVIVEINQNNRLGALYHLDMVVAIVHIFNRAAADVVGLKAVCCFQIVTVHLVALGENVLDASGNFRTDGYAAVAVNKGVVLQHDVKARAVDAQTIAVSAGLDCHAVITNINRVVADNHITGAFRITAVVVVQMAVDRNAVYQNGITQNRIDFPHRRILNRNAFNQDILAVVRLNEVRTKEAVICTAPLFMFRLTVLALSNRNIGLTLTIQLVDCRILRLDGRAVCIGALFLPLLPYHGLRMLAVANTCLTVQRAFTGQRDVLLAVCVNQRRIVHQLYAFKTGQSQALLVYRVAINFLHQIAAVQAGIRGELQRRILFNAQIDIVFQMNRCGIEYLTVCCRNDNRAAAGFADCLDCCINRLGIGLCHLRFCLCICVRLFVCAFHNVKNSVRLCAIVHDAHLVLCKDGTHSCNRRVNMTADFVCILPRCRRIGKCRCVIQIQSVCHLIGQQRITLGVVRSECRNCHAAGHNRHAQHACDTLSNARCDILFHNFLSISVSFYGRQAPTPPPAGKKKINWVIFVLCRSRHRLPAFRLLPRSHGCSRLLQNA